MVLAQLLAEDRQPDPYLWNESLVSSRLLEYETWVRLNSRGLAHSHGEAATQLLGRISYIELSPVVLGRVLEPFPAPVRTLDAIHLASLDYLLNARVGVELATYDQAMTDLATALGLPLSKLIS